jgi:hypothetical protein
LKPAIRLYFIGLYENNSLGRWPSFFREDCFHFLHLGTSLVIGVLFVLLTLRFVHSRSELTSRPEGATSIPAIVGLAFCLVIYSVKVLPLVKRITPDYYEEDARDFQLPMGPTLSQGALEQVHIVVLIYIPSAIILFFCYLGPLIFYLRGPILALTSMLPSIIRYHTGRFVRAMERCMSLCPLPFLLAVLI